MTSSNDHDRLRALLEGAFAVGDLEAHVAALVLADAYSSPLTSVSPWSNAIYSLLSAPALVSMRSPHDVAVSGIRLALGAQGDDRDTFRSAAKRELGREPLPPAACLHDDERVLLGIAAGIGMAAEHLSAELHTVLNGRANGVSFGQHVIDIWAESLALRSRRLNDDLAASSYELLTSFRRNSRAATDTERIRAVWLATRLLDANWHPTDVQVEELDELVTDGVRSIRTMLALGSELNALDAAMLFDLLSASPLARVTRRSALETTLAISERFAASAAVLSARQRKRRAFQIKDEYDVQDLFRALASPHVPDIVPEDPAPKLAGHSSRLDFTSRSARLGFELKYVKGASRVKDIRNEIMLDERTYQEHPYVDTVLVFVHDPACHIPLPDRSAFEADLSVSVTVSGRTVRYVVRVG